MCPGLQTSRLASVWKFIISVSFLNYDNLAFHHIPNDRLIIFSVYISIQQKMPLQVKDKVEQLVPKSEELLSQTQRQERAISNIHNDLKEKTNAIMKELSDVERELLTTKTTSANVVKAEVEQQRASVPPRVVRGHVQRVQRPSVLMPLALPLIRDFNEDTESVEVTTYGNIN